jgi:hypothetical protein
MSFTQVLLLAMFGGAVTFGVLFVVRQRQAWNAYAARHGWTYTPAAGVPRLRGLHQGRTVSVFTESHRSDSDVPTSLVIELDVGDVLPRSLKVAAPEFRSTLLGWLGMRDEAEGGAVPDLPPRTLAVLRAPSVREHLLGLRDHYSDCALSEGHLKLERSGVPGTIDDLEVAVGPALDLGEALDAASRAAGPARG